MPLPSVQDASYPDLAQVRDTILRAILFAYARRGIVANVLPGSDHFIRAEKYASRVSIAIANNELALADFNPLTSTGNALVTLAGIFGVSRRPAGPAAGTVVITSVGAVSIPANFQCGAPNGRKYKTVSLSTGITTDALVDVIALSGGADTNQIAGTVLTWDSAAIGALKSTCVVGPGGLSGGANEDDDETLRTRLLNKLAFPPGGGNASQIAEFAEESTASVEAAYVYAAARGPASYDVAVTKRGGDRVLPAATVTIVANFINGKMPGQNDLNCTTVTKQLVDIVLEATLPLPVSGGGAGGGWRDANPWPVAPTKVTVVGVNTVTVDSVIAPVAGQSFGIWDSTATTPVMREYTAASVGGSVGAWVITVNETFAPAPIIGAYVSAGAFSLVAYANLFAAQMKTLGPGEKTDTLELLPRARRFPPPDVRDPSNLASRLLVPLQTTFPEISDIDFALAVTTGGTSPADDLAAPSIPLTTADPPNILVMAEFAIIAPP